MTAQFASLRRGSHVSSVLAPSFPELVVCASLSRQRQVQGHPISPQAASGKLLWPAKAVRGSERRCVSPQATQVHTGPGSPPSQLCPGRPGCGPHAGLGAQNLSLGSAGVTRSHRHFVSISPLGQWVEPLAAPLLFTTYARACFLGP